MQNQAGLGSEYQVHGVLVRNTAQLGLWVFLATVAMLFAAFTSAYVVRSAGSDWMVTPLPPILWFNTVILLASSVVLEMARFRGRRSPPAAPLIWYVAAVLLGVWFLVGQLFAWRQLAEMGVFIPTNPHSSFFYLLTGVHAVHLVGALLLLAFVSVQVGTARSLVRGNRSGLEGLAATLWHFLAGLWLYLFILLSVW